jgi:Na+-transporting NADH:ubiquinone oxidoreductase subunit C
MKSKLSMILFVLILGSSLTTALVSVDYYTKEPIARNKRRKLQKGILSSLNIEYGENDPNEIFSANVETIITKGDEAKKFYRSKTSGDIAFEFHGMGLWGPISGTIALSPDLQQIQGLSITHQEETPGLGGRIAEGEFLNRFEGKKVAAGIAILSPGKAKAENEVDGITGATLSCKAFEAILNEELKKYVPIIKETR